MRGKTAKTVPNPPLHERQLLYNIDIQRERAQVISPHKKNRADLRKHT
jgi:hypothetical protein